MRTDLKVPFADKDEAKALGARWDSTNRTWYIDDGLSITSFEKWLPFPLWQKSNGVSGNMARKEIGGQVTLGSSHIQQRNTCECTLWGECEQCRVRRIK